LERHKRAIGDTIVAVNHDSGHFMTNRFHDVFGHALGVILLLLYAVAAWLMIVEIIKACHPHGCTVAIKSDYGDGFRYVLTTVGGLVSALVIARLSIAKPGTMVSLTSLERETDQAKPIYYWIAATYLLVWMVTGLAALVFGVMLHPQASATVSDLGTVWLGLAVAAGYAYFGLTPPE
jgi:hypothetical protein